MIVEDGLQTTDLLIEVVDNLANELLADNPKVISGQNEKLCPICESAILKMKEPGGVPSLKNAA